VARFWPAAGQDRHQRGFNHFDPCSVEHTVRDLGVIFDSRLTMADHVAAVCRSGSYQLRQLRPVVRSLSADGAKQWSMASFHAGLTTATRYLLASPIACFVDYSRSRMQPPVLLPALLDVNTSRRYSGNFIGYQYVSVFDTSWQPWHSDHYQARRLPARC